MCIEEQTTKSTEKTKQYMNKKKKKYKQKLRNFELLQIKRVSFCSIFVSRSTTVKRVAPSTSIQSIPKIVLDNEKK